MERSFDNNELLNRAVEAEGGTFERSMDNNLCLNRLVQAVGGTYEYSMDNNLCLNRLVETLEAGGGGGGGSNPQFENFFNKVYTGTFTFTASKYNDWGMLISEAGIKYNGFLLPQNVVVEDGVDYLLIYWVYSPFANQTQMVNITLPSTITRIQNYTFSGCTSLSSITIPNSVTIIDNRAFDGCTSLSSITIPNSVTSIDSYAFDGCTSLPVIDNIRYADTCAVEAIDKTLSTYTIKNGTRFILGTFFSCTNLTSITIPSSVTVIENNAFAFCTSLTSITIPSSVTVIENNAFNFCTSLSSITIPDGVTSIANSTFNYCISLSSITIPNSVTSIGDSAFYCCTSLSSITIPDGVTTIGDRTFNSCTGLTSVVIGSGVTSIGEGAFNNCSSLTSITIPSSVTVIENEAFDCCTSLSDVTYGGTVSQFEEMYTAQPKMFRETPVTVVHCSDGDYTLPVPETIKVTYESSNGESMSQSGGLSGLYFEDMGGETYNEETGRYEIPCSESVESLESFMFFNYAEDEVVYTIYLPKNVPINIDVFDVITTQVVLNYGGSEEEFSELVMISDEESFTNGIVDGTVNFDVE